MSCAAPQRQRIPLFPESGLHEAAGDIPLDLNCAWPGNVRGLENFIERSVILSQGSTLRGPLAELRADGVKPGGGTLAEMEHEYIVRVLRDTGGVISTAATRLGLPRTTLGIARRDL